MPFSLLSPWYLLAGLGAVLPILIHLLQRRREVVLPFSMVRFVLLAQKRSSRRLRLKRLFLLLLRVSMIFLLALILARPVLFSPTAVFGEGEPGFTVVVLDNSLSLAVRVGGRSLFEIARHLVADIASRAVDEENFALIEAVEAAGPRHMVTWERRKDFLETLSQVEIRPRVGAFAGATGRAYSLLREVSSADKRILVVTDLGRGGWEDFSLHTVGGVDSTIPVRIFRLGGGQAGNRAGIIGVEIRGESRVAGDPKEVAAQVVNFGPGNTLSVELWLDGRLLDRKFAKVVPGREGEVIFKVSPQMSGTFRGELRLAEDLYPEDDRRYFGLEFYPPVSVLLVDGDPRSALIQSETFFLQEALRPERLSPLAPVAVTVVNPEEFSQTTLAGFQVVILANLPAPASQEAKRILDFIASGGGLIIFWGENCLPEEYLHVFPGLLPGHIDSISTAPAGQPYRLGEIDYTVKMLSVFRPPGHGTFTTASFSKRAELDTSAADAKVVARFSDGRPWILQSRFGRGMVLFFSSTADLEWNDLATKPVYVPLMQRAVLEISGNLTSAREKDLVAGEPKFFEGRPDLAFTRMEVESPAGIRREIEFRPGEAGVRARFEDTGQVGFYTYFRQGREGVFAVNVPPRESDLRSLTEEEVSARFPRVKVDIIPVGEGAGAEGLSHAGVRSLSRPLFIALFFLMLLEMLVAGPRHLKRNSKS